MTIPTVPSDPPPLVVEEAAGRPVTAVWRNDLGGVTWQIGEGAGRDFLKIGPEHPEFDIPGELQRLDWLAEYLPVPTVVSCGVSDDGVWLRTRGLPGDNAIAPHNVARADVVVPALGRGLRRLHDTLPADECPFAWSAEQRVGLLTKPFDEPLPAIRPGDEVVCHGDACNPNFLVGDDGEVVGYVDLSRVGVADRHADLAPALLSLGWNFGEGWDDAFLAAYCGNDLTVDPERIAFHQRLWNAE